MHFGLRRSLRTALYALTVVALLVAGVVAQQSGGAFLPHAAYTVTGPWTFASLPALTGYGSAVGTSGAQTIANKTLTAPVLTNPAITSITPVDVTATPLAVTAASHCMRTITLNRAAGVAVTLPAASGTGCVYTFVVGTTFTGDATIKAASASDFFHGTAVLLADAGDTVVGFVTANTGTAATESDTVDLFDAGNVTGGIKGAVVVLRDMKANLWSVEYRSDAAGAEVTPFKATVS